MRVRSTRDIAAAVRGRRKDLAMSQDELARRARVARKSISELESGRSEPRVPLLLRVLAELDLGLEIAAARLPATRRSVDLDALLDEHRHK